MTQIVSESEYNRLKEALKHRFGATTMGEVTWGDPERTNEIPIGNVNMDCMRVIGDVILVPQANPPTDCMRIRCQKLIFHPNGRLFVNGDLVLHAEQTSGPVSIDGSPRRTASNGAEGRDGSHGANGADGTFGKKGKDASTFHHANKGGGGGNGGDGGHGTNGMSGQDGEAGADGHGLSVFLGALEPGTTINVCSRGFNGGNGGNGGDGGNGGKGGNGGHGGHGGNGSFGKSGNNGGKGGNGGQGGNAGTGGSGGDAGDGGDGGTVKLQWLHGVDPAACAIVVDQGVPGHVGKKGIQGKQGAGGERGEGGFCGKGGPFGGNGGTDGDGQAGKIGKPAQPAKDGSPGNEGKPGQGQAFPCTYKEAIRSLVWSLPLDVRVQIGPEFFGEPPDQRTTRSLIEMVLPLRVIDREPDIDDEFLARRMLQTVMHLLPSPCRRET